MKLQGEPTNNHPTSETERVSEIDVLMSLQFTAISRMSECLSELYEGLTPIMANAAPVPPGDPEISGKQYSELGARINGNTVLINKICDRLCDMRSRLAL